MQLQGLLGRIVEVAKSPRVNLELYGSLEARRIYKRFTSPHRLVPLVPSKGFGAALFELPRDPTKYLSGKAFKAARHNRQMSLKTGMRFLSVPALEYVDDMLAINRSLPERQGRPIAKTYIDAEAVTAFCERIGQVYAVVDGTGRMQAYAHAPVLGDIFHFTRLLGHADALNKGVMYFLVAETTLQMIERRRVWGYPKWAMYDMFLGGSEGLQYFKKRMGFRPYRVNWSLRDDHA